MKITPIFAEAVSDITLCRFARNRFESLLGEFPELGKQLLAMASNELVQAQDQMRLLGRKTARKMSCLCIVSLARRAKRRGGGPSPVSLSISPADIAD